MEKEDVTFWNGVFGKNLTSKHRAFKCAIPAVCVPQLQSVYCIVSSIAHLVTWWWSSKAAETCSHHIRNKLGNHTVVYLTNPHSPFLNREPAPVAVIFIILQMPAFQFCYHKSPFWSLYWCKIYFKTILVPKSSTPEWPLEFYLKNVIYILCFLGVFHIFVFVFHRSDWICGSPSHWNIGFRSRAQADF